MRLKIAVVGFLTTIYLFPAYAVTDEERSALQRLHSELIGIQEIINEAEQNSNDKGRYLVDYDQLKGDMGQVQQGIEDILNSRRLEPRLLPPIEGDYR